MTVGEVWADYIEQRRLLWGALHYRDHIDKAQVGGFQVTDVVALK